MSILPASSLKLEWIYGYRGHQCRNNLVYGTEDCIVYFVAGVGVVFDTKKQTQKFYLGHDDDIISLAIHADNCHIATGQVGKSPQINVWNCSTLETVAILKDGHQHGISSLSFSRDGSKLLSVGSDPYSTLVLWEWKKGKILSTTRGHSAKIFDVRFTPNSSQSQNFLFVTCGMKHIKFWSHSGNTLTSKKGIFGKAGEIQTMMSLVFEEKDQSGNELLTTLSVTLSGDVYIWKSERLNRVVENIHKGAIYTIINYNAKCYATGGKDGKVKILDCELNVKKTFDLSQLHTTDITVRSLYSNQELQHDKMLVGTKDSEIIEITANKNEEMSPECLLMQGHGEGELWALACHSNLFVTGSDDNTIRVWDKRTRKMKLITKMDISIRSCSVNSDMSLIAIGLVDGSFAILHAKDLKLFKRIKNRKEVIHEIKFSPNDLYLAVGSNDNFVDIYDCQNSFQKLGTCSGSSSFITHLDWSKDSKYVITNSGAAESLIFNAPDGKRVTSSNEIEQITWESITCVLGNEIKGIWPKYSCTNDVNSCDIIRSSRDVVVTADDFGLVKLLKYPCEKKGAKFKKYTGHSAHVTNVRFTLDNQSVISVGGADHAIFQWRYISDKKNDEPEDFSESDEDSDYTNKPIKTPIPVDSDVEKDNERNYERPFDKNEIVKLQKKNRKKSNSSAPVKTPRNNDIRQKLDATPNKAKVELNENQGAPDDSLQLEHVFGYRGFDGRNNVHYLKNNEKIVYHTAAIGVVMSLANKTQQFYLGHDDDILSLTIHPLKNIIATGQVGKNPPIHVWDGESLKTLSILKDHHSRGVCSLDFTKDGKKLASVGLDENHCIVVWDWKKGIKIASTRGHKDRVYIVKWNPHDEDKLVTAGNKHIKFWSQAGNGFMSKRGVFGKVSDGETILCVAYGKVSTSCFSGGVKGLVHCWGGKAGNVLWRVVQAHQGPIFSMCTTDGIVFTTSGKDKKITIWEKDFNNTIKTINMDSFERNKSTSAQTHKSSMVIRSAVTRSNNNFVLIGTKESEILEYSVRDGKVDVIVQGHEEGELWGLACHPSKMYVATTSDDCTLRIWSVGDKPGLISMKSLDRPSRSVDFSPDGKLIAVGAIDGSVSIIETTSMTEKRRLKKRKQNISDIKFSPSPGSFMAVGSHDNFVDIYDVNNNFVCVGVCKSASSYITHIDWDAEGKLLQVNTGAKEILYYEAPMGNRITPSQREAEAIDWVTWTAVLGQWCEGIWAAYSDITDVNSTCLTKDKKLIATGDDFGFVKLFSFPVKAKNAKHKKYTGHSAHVTNVRWCCDDRTLVSIGGGDCSVLVWKLKRKSELKTSKSFYEGRSESRSEISYKSNESKPTAFQNDESASSNDDDDDEEGVGGYDSDIEKEIKIDYVSKFNVDPLRYQNDKTLSNENNEKEIDSPNFGFKSEQNRKNEIENTFFGRFKNHELKDESSLNNNFFIESIKNMYSRKLQRISEEDKTPINKFESLKLESIFGYRGYDSRNNVHYLDNDEIIYPAAATVVVLHLNTDQQRFYLGHNDDIICLATNQNPRFKYVIATGEIGHKPVIHVWNAKSMTTTSILSGLQDGVRIVDFSCSGKLLVAVGIDTCRTVAVYDWQEGIQLASSKSLKKPLYHLEYRPDSDRHFVSVGLRSIHFWTLVGNTLMSKKGDMTTYNGTKPSTPNFKMTFLSLAFGMNDVTYSGSITGDVYVWRGVCLERIVQCVHNGPVITMYTSLFDGLIVTGGKERNNQDCKNVKLWDQEMKKSMPFDISKCNRKKLQHNQETIVKSVSRIKGKIIVGTRSNKLIEIKENENEMRVVSSSHSDGELWGLSTHPRDADVVATAGDDGLLFVWSLKNKKPLLSTVIGACRSLDYNSNGNWLASGHVNGTFQILSTNHKYKSICEKRLRGSSVTVIKFTCDDNYIISACKDNFIDLYKINYNNNKNADKDDESIVSNRTDSYEHENIDVYRVCSCDLKNAMAISIDVSNDSKYIKVGTVNYTNRYFNLPNLTEVLIETIPSVIFNDFTSLSDKEVKGTWPSNQKTNHHVNCCHVTSGKNHIVTGDDYGLVKLFKYPSSEQNAKFEYMIGHSAHVTNIRFTCNDLKVISTGGDDSCVFVWKCI